MTLRRCLFPWFGACVLLVSVLHAASVDRTVVLISVDGLAHYYFDDPQAEMPNLRRMAKEGARAEKMQAVMPTVTWPNHTTLVTGVSPAKHGVLGNSLFNRSRNEVIALIWDPLLDKEAIVKVPTIYDVAKQAGLKTAAVTWPGSRAAPSLDWTVPCVKSSELYIQYTTPSLLAEFKQAGIPYENAEDGFKPGRGEERDRIHVRMLRHILRAHRPHVALLHLLEVDHIEHAYGPQSPEAYAAVKFADGLVGEVREELERSVPGKGTIIVVSDHGFFNYRQFIRPNVLLRKEGLLNVQGPRIVGGQVRALSQGGSSMLFVDPAAPDRDALIVRLARTFKEMAGVALVLTPKEFAEYGFPSPRDNPQMGDLVLSAREGYTFSDAAVGDEVVTAPLDKAKGSHGYSPREPRLHASFIAWGSGIRPGTRLGTIRNTAVAPTMAALLNVRLPETESPPLKQILAP